MSAFYFLPLEFVSGLTFQDNYGKLPLHYLQIAIEFIFDHGAISDFQGAYKVYYSFIQITDFLNSG